MKTINNYTFKNKNILLRVDLNVPVHEGKVTDTSRIKAIKSTLIKLINKKNKVFLLSHFGRPSGKPNKKYSLEFLKNFICDEVGINKIYFLKSIKTEEIKSIQDKMSFGEVCLLENIRFYKEEEANDLDFSKELSKSFDLYVNDAFSASHRYHASIVNITKFLPSLAGDSLLTEIKNLNIFFNNPEKPNTAIIGGSKISTKIELLNNLIENFDNIIIGGAMANTFLLSQGYIIGNSLVEKKFLDLAKNIINKAKDYQCNFILPIDVVCSNSINDQSNIKKSLIQDVLSDQAIFDIGDKSIQIIKDTIIKSRMVLWNGPLGAFEYKPFDYATKEIANCINQNTNNPNLTSLAGGGDTISAIWMAKAEKGFTYMSNAGGAFLEWLEGNESPGIISLRENKIN